MKINFFNIVLVFFGISFLLTGCSISNQSMKYPNYHIEFYKADFEYSKQVTAEATSVRIFMIDWNRLFHWETGQIESDRFQSANNQNISVSGVFNADQVFGSLSTIIPVLGDYGKGKISSYALYKLMEENPGYDVVIYPRYETKRFFIPLFYSKRSVKVTARLGKIK